MTGTVAERPRVALLVVQGGGRDVFGGAERLYDGLSAGLDRAGFRVERVAIASDESSFDAVLQSYLSAFDTDLSACDAVISTKAPSFAIRHRRHVAYIPHTMRTFYDMADAVAGASRTAFAAQRSLVHRIDAAALSRPSVRGVFSVGEEARQRLLDFAGIDSRVIRHPSSLSGLHGGRFRHLLVPGRLHAWKRVDLVLEAVRHMRNDIEVVVCGTGEEEGRLKAAARDMKSVRFAGHVSDEALAALYADAFAVAFCPVREDYGLVAVEAFACGKPVVTCADSGEPARLVQDGVNGFVSPADPRSLAQCFDRLAENEPLARQMGDRAGCSALHADWADVCSTLAGALGYGTGQGQA